jgi:ferredoxin-NADP reductase
MIERSYRKLVVKSVVPESESAKSFFLTPADGGPLDLHFPGQHLPLRLNIPNHQHPVFRCYTISNYDDDFYRLTIKRESAPPDRPELPSGLSSSFFHDEVRPSDVLDAKPPSGNFWLDLHQDHPVVMLAGGIGVTPMMSMLEALDRAASTRTVYFFFALRHSGDHVFRSRLRNIAERRPNLRMRVFYEEVRSHDIEGRDYQHAGRVTIATLREHLPSLDMEYYICGPPGMMKALTEGLAGAGVAPEAIRTESFGPSSAAFLTLAASGKEELASSSEITVTFARSKITVPWTGEVPSLLQLAEINRVDISSGCQYGDCGTCMVRLLEGKVSYRHSTGARIDPGCCLPCSCRPETSIVLDA